MNFPEAVKPITRAKVEAAMLALNFRPNQMARALATNRSGVIAILVDYVGGGYYSMLLDALEQKARQRGFQTIIRCGNSNADDIYRSVKQLSGGQCDAIVACVPFMKENELKQLLQLQPNTVFMNCVSTAYRQHAIVVDNQLGTTLALENLYQHGHRCIGIMTGVEDNVENIERLSAVKAWFEKKALRFSDKWLISGNFCAENARHAIHQLLNQAPELTALFCFNDQMALGVMSYLQQQGEQLPERLSIIGFDNTEACAFTHPTLTSVEQPIQEMAHRAMNIIENMLNERSLQEQLPLVPSLINRHSVASLSKSM
jgi:Transcriptional regulators